MKKKISSNICKWEFDHVKEEKTYVKCKVCQRVKRSDLPNTRPCTGKDLNDYVMIRQILVQQQEQEFLEYMNS